MNKMKKNNLRNLREALFMFAAICVCTITIHAQGDRVTGIVKDELGDPLTGTAVVVKGTINGSVTDIDGRYTLNQVASGSILQFSFVGYQTQEIRVADLRTINVNMIPADQSIDEVVVIGYGSVRRSDVTGSIVSINAEEMLKRSPITVGQGLQGVASGVAVYRNSGSPAGDVTVRVRGIGTINNSADPLYVVDGIPAGTNVSFLNPNDIESLEVLKDASATAIYGAQGANGVILITTKRGLAGQTKLTFSANYTVTSRPKPFDMLNAYDFAHASRETAQNDGAQLTNPAWVQYDSQLKSIDWQKEMSRTALQQNYNVNISGGSNNTQSVLSVGYMNNDGAMIASNFKRLTLRTNIDHTIKDFIKAGLSINYTYTESYGNGNRNSVSTANIIPTMDQLDANNNLVNVPIRWDSETDNPFHDGKWGHFLIEGAGNTNKSLDNPVAAAMTNNNHGGNGRLFSTAYLQINILKNLIFRTDVGFNYYSNSSNNYRELNPRSYLTSTQEDQLSFNGSVNKRYSIESYLNYNLEINSINRLNLMAGWSANKYDGQELDINVQTLAWPTLREISAGNLETLSGSGRLLRKERGESFFGRIIYSLMDRYVLQGTVRREGSSNFGPGNRYGTFPSASLLWRVSEEEFMKSQSIFSKMNLRLSWGQSGNSGNSTNQYIDQLQAARIIFWFYDANRSPIAAPGLAKTRLIDPKLKWETNEVTNITLEVGFLKNALTFNAEYFIRDSKDLLLNRSIRPSLGYTTIYTNAGQIRNSGFDFQVTYQKRSHDLSYSIKLNGGTIKNEAIDVGEPILSTNGASTQEGWTNWSRTENGAPIAQWHGYRVAGVFQNQAEIDSYNERARAAGSDYYQGSIVKPGDFIFKDLDGNGYINEEDREILGHGFPKVNYGLNASVSYKNWDFNIFMYGIGGQKILSHAQMNLTYNIVNDVGYKNMLKSAYDNAWRESKPNNQHARLTNVDSNNNRRISDYFIQNGDFLKIQSLQIGYSFPREWVRTMKMESARLFAGVENLFTITGYKFGDPEIGSNSILQTGLDTGRYPTARMFNIGVNVQF